MFTIFEPLVAHCRKDVSKTGRFAARIFRRLFVSLRLEETAEIQDTNETNIVIKDSSIGTTKIFSLMKVDLSFDIIPKELRISPSTKFHNLPKSICI